MAMDRHPSRKPGQPRRPPATSTTSGMPNKIEGRAKATGEDAQYGFKHEANLSEHVPYGSTHKVAVKPAHKSEMAHHFSDFGKAGDQGEIE